MSRPVVVIGLLALLAAVVVGVWVTDVQNKRLAAHLVTSRNNLRELALHAAHHANTDPKAEPREVPAGTVPLFGVPPDDRLSWVVTVLPWLDQRRNPVEELLQLGALDKPWADPANQEAARVRLPVVTCPENTPEVPADAPAVTCYVGVAGLGRDAATIRLVPGVPTPPRAGAFRYDAPTPFARITDGLSQTVLMAEAADAPGPWLRGGFPTVRGLDDSAGAKPPIGVGGQFGGFFPAGANVAMCDGAVQTFSPKTDPAVLYRLVTIAGEGPAIGVPD